MTDFAAMSDADLLALLRAEEDRLPLAAAKEIVRRGEGVQGALIDILNEDGLWEDEDKEWWALAHAVRLLALISKPDSFDFVLAAIERAYDEDVEWVWNEAREILAAYGPSQHPALVATLKSAIDYDDLQACCLEALAVHAAHGEFSTERLFELAVSLLFKDGRTTELEESAESVLSLWIRNGSEAEVAKALGEDLPAAKRTYRSIWRGANLFVEAPNEWFSRPNLWRFYSEAAIKGRAEMWERFDDQPLNFKEEDFEAGVDAEEEDDGDLPPPPLRADPKPGRNDPCPCGSGKKFKKCCEGKDVV